MRYEIHRFNAGLELDKTVLGTFVYFYSALTAIKKMPQSIYIVYGIYDKISKKYLRFVHNYHPIDNPMGDIEKVKSGSY